MIKQIERLQLIAQRLRGRPLSVEELQVEVEKALDEIILLLKKVIKKGE